MKTFYEFASEQEITRKWEDTGLLKQVNDRVGCALCLENQRISLLNSVKDKEYTPLWERIAIPLMRRVFGSGLISGTNEPCQGWYEFESVKLPTRRDTRNWNLDDEADMCAHLAQQVVDEIKEAMYLDLNRKPIKVVCFEKRGDRLWMNYGV